MANLLPKQAKPAYASLERQDSVLEEEIKVQEEVKTQKSMEKIVKDVHDSLWKALD